MTYVRNCRIRKGLVLAALLSIVVVAKHAPSAEAVPAPQPPPPVPGEVGVTEDKFTDTAKWQENMSVAGGEKYEYKIQGKIKLIPAGEKRYIASFVVEVTHKETGTKFGPYSVEFVVSERVFKTELTNEPVEVEIRSWVGELTSVKATPELPIFPLSGMTVVLSGSLSWLRGRRRGMGRSTFAE